MHTRARLPLLLCALALACVCGTRTAHAAARYSFSTDPSWSLTSVRFEGTSGTFELDKPFSIGSFDIRSPGLMEPGTLYMMAIRMQLPDFTQSTHVPGNPGWFQMLQRSLIITGAAVRETQPDGSNSIVARNFNVTAVNSANFTLPDTDVFPFPAETIEIPSFTIASSDAYDPNGQYRRSITMTIHSQSQSGPIRPSNPDPVPVPEPSTFLILSAAVGAFAYHRRKPQR